MYHTELVSLTTFPHLKPINEKIKYLKSPWTRVTEHNLPYVRPPEFQDYNQRSGMWFGREVSDLAVYKHVLI